MKFIKYLSLLYITGAIYKVGRLLSLIFLIVRMEFFKFKVEESKETAHNITLWQAVHPRHITESIKTAFKPRDNHKRYYLWMYISIMLIVCLPLFGENSIGYNYVRTRYKWGVEEYSNYRTIAEVIDITGHVIFLPLFGVMKFRDSLIIPILLVTIMIRDALKAFAEYPWMYYLGTTVAVMGGYTFSATRSIISQCVASDELGKVFALMSSLECMIPIYMSQVYASIWKATSEAGPPWVGTIYIVSGWIFSFCINITSDIMQ